MIVLPAGCGQVGRRNHPPALPFVAVKYLRWASGATAVVAVVLLFRMGVFMVDPGRTTWSIQPDDKWRREHSCLTAYTEAARLLSEGTANVYERTLYADPDRFIGGLKVDAYHYPPPFLLLPSAIQKIRGD